VSGDTVRMTHPDLDLDEPVEMPASAVPFHAAAGWRVVEDTPAEDEPHTTSTQDQGADKAKSRPSAAKSKEKN